MVAQKLDIPSAKSTKAAKTVKKDFVESLGIESQSVPLHHVLWLYGQEIKDLYFYTLILENRPDIISDFFCSLLMTVPTLKETKEETKLSIMQDN